VCIVQYVPILKAPRRKNSVLFRSYQPSHDEAFIIDILHIESLLISDLENVRIKAKEQSDKRHQNKGQSHFSLEMPLVIFLFIFPKGLH
jgi:hypothetical protein